MKTIRVGKWTLHTVRGFRFWELRLKRGSYHHGRIRIYRWLGLIVTRTDFRGDVTKPPPEEQA